MTEQCRACRAGLEHCHGALIHHSHRRDECTEPDCFVTDVAHALHLDCDAVGCTCAIPLSASAHRVG